MWPVNRLIFPLHVSDAEQDIIYQQPVAHAYLVQLIVRYAQIFQHAMPAKLHISLPQTILANLALYQTV